MTTFDDLTDVYESLVDWPKRLAREAPFYRHLFANHDVQSVADVACGTGHHAAMFHQWGLRVEGADVSRAMIDRARSAFGESAQLRWSVRSFETPTTGSKPADAVVCVGNSLALASDHCGVQTALQAMLSAVRPGGIVIVHVLNLWKLPDGPCQWQKCVHLDHPEGVAMVVKGVHRSGTHGYVNLVISSVNPPRFLKTESVPLLGLTAEQISQWAREAGARDVHLFGDYQRAVYESATSPDLIAVIEKPTLK